MDTIESNIGVIKEEQNDQGYHQALCYSETDQKPELKDEGTSSKMSELCDIDHVKKEIKQEKNEIYPSTSREWEPNGYDLDHHCKVEPTENQNAPKDEHDSFKSEDTSKTTVENEIQRDTCLVNVVSQPAISQIPRIQSLLRQGGLLIGPLYITSDGRIVGTQHSKTLDVKVGLQAQVNANTNHCNTDSNHVKSTNLKKLLTCDKRISSKRTKTSCPVCQQIFNSRSNLYTHMLKHPELKRHSCSICQKPFILLSSLKKHMYFHAKQKDVQCTICSKMFPSKTSMKAHRVIHKGEKFTCEVCGKAFNYPLILKSHMRLHSDEKPHSCNLCGKSFRLRQNLRNHIRIHTGEKPYACEKCEKRFTQKSGLRQHMRTHDDNSWEHSRIDYPCDVCGKIFHRKSSLTKHKRFVSCNPNRTCPHCQRKFKNAHSFQNHLDKHERIKKEFEDSRDPNLFMCMICQLKVFKYKAKLKWHMLQYHRNKMYKCPKCEEYFLESADRDAHIPTHKEKKKPENPSKKLVALKGLLNGNEKSQGGSSRLSGFLAHKEDSQAGRDQQELGSNRTVTLKELLQVQNHPKSQLRQEGDINKPTQSNISLRDLLTGEKTVTDGKDPQDGDCRNSIQNLATLRDMLSNK